MNDADDTLGAVAKALRSGDDFLVVSHAGPDGDAIGSLLAVGELLERHGKRVLMYNTDGVPEALQFLPGASRVASELPSQPAMWAIVLDCSTPDRVSDAFARQRPFKKSIVLDHHLTDRNFGDIAYVDSSAAATGEVIYRLAKELSWRGTPAFATSVYTAIFADTGSFQFSNTSARILRIASELAELGADPAAIADRMFSAQSPARVDMMKNVLETLEYAGNGRVAVITVWQGDMKRTQASKYDLEGLVNIPRSIKGVQIAAQIREVVPGREYRISLRSKLGFDVERIAARFSGGGHKHAAGCTIRGNYQEVRSQLFPLMEQASA